MWTDTDITESFTYLQIMNVDGNKLQIVDMLQMVRYIFCCSYLAEGENQKGWGFGSDQQNQRHKETENTDTNQLQQTINKRQHWRQQHGCIQATEPGGQGQQRLVHPGLPQTAEGKFRFEQRFEVSLK